MARENTIIIRVKRKTLSLHILPDGTVEVKVPMYVPMRFIEEFLEKNKAWIEKRKKLVGDKMVLPKTYTDGEKFLFLGNEYTLVIGNYSTIQILGTEFHFPKALLFRAKKEIENWYIRQAKEIITKQTEKYALEMKTKYKSITFSDTKSQWGRCTYDNRLQFSWKLVMTPLLVINYVVIHELAHTFEKNHSLLFWAKVRSVMPSYKQQIKWLKANGKTLVV